MRVRVRVMARSSEQLVLAASASLLLLTLIRFRFRANKKIVEKTCSSKLPARWYIKNGGQKDRNCAQFRIDFVDDDPSGRIGGLSAIRLKDGNFNTDEAWVNLEYIINRENIILYCISFEGRFMSYFSFKSNLLTYISVLVLYMYRYFVFDQSKRLSISRYIYFLLNSETLL